jgi:transposase
LFAQGRTQAEVAHQLGVSRQSAHVWYARFQEGGVDALRSRGPTGPDPKLSAVQLAQVEQALLQGALANGFNTDLWTLERVAAVITQLTGVHHHPGHVWVILRRRLGWSLQRPERRASERDEEAIARWVAQEWPRIKRGSRGIGLDRLLRRIGRLADPTGPPDLVTPGPHPGAAASVRLEEGLHGRRPRLSARRQRCPAVFHLQQPSYDTDSLIKVLDQLGTFYAGQRVVLLWDGLSAPGATGCVPTWTATATGCVPSGCRPTPPS